MLTNKELKEEWIKEMCEPKEDSERFAVYENDGELVANWFLSQRDKDREELNTLIETTRKRFKCGTCDGAKCEHTLGCLALSDLQAKLKQDE